MWHPAHVAVAVLSSFTPPAFARCTEWQMPHLAVVVW